MDRAHAHRAHGRRIDIGAGTASGPAQSDTSERGEVLFRDLDVDASAAGEGVVLERLRGVHAGEPALAPGCVLVQTHDRCRRRPLSEAELARTRVRQTDRHGFRLGQVGRLDGQLALCPMQLDAVFAVESGRPLARLRTAAATQFGEPRLLGGHWRGPAGSARDSGVGQKVSPTRRLRRLRDHVEATVALVGEGGRGSGWPGVTTAHSVTDSPYPFYRQTQADPRRFRARPTPTLIHTRGPPDTATQPSLTHNANVNPKWWPTKLGSLATDNPV